VVVVVVVGVGAATNALNLGVGSDLQTRSLGLERHAFNRQSHLCKMKSIGLYKRFDLSWVKKRKQLTNKTLFC
jgi:hypothetical protein